MRGAWFVRGVLGLGLAGMMALAPMAFAQVPEQPAQGSLHPPTAAERAAAAKPSAPPSAAPRTGVQQVSPYATPMPTPPIKSGKATAAKPAHAPTGLGHSEPGKPSALDHKAAPEKAKAKAKGKPDGKTPPAKPDAAKPDAVKPDAAKPDAKADAPAAGPAGADPQLGSMTKQPLPRWASLKTDEVNIRSGPGSRYPIQWVYHRTMLPVQIEREFDNWRLIEDQEGVKGWAHTATLTSRRGFVVRPGAERVMRRSPAEDASAVARLQAGVVGRLRACEAQAAWCEVQVQGYRGWMRRDDIYGLSPGEAVTP